MNNRLKAVTLVLILAILGCTSVSNFVGMPDRNDPGLNVKDLEDDSMGASAPDAVGSSAPETYQMTPEEANNSGQHSYTYNVSLGDQVNSGTSKARHEFNETGVTYWIDDNDPLEFLRVGQNEYALENGNITLKYTLAGYESDMASGHYYIFTFEE